MKTMIAMLGFAALAAGCGPSPDDVCKKTFDLLKGEVGEAGANQAIGGDLKACVDRETVRKDRQGLVKYRENNQCLMDAKSAADVTNCSKKK